MYWYYLLALENKIYIMLTPGELYIISDFFIMGVGEYCVWTHIMGFILIKSGFILPRERIL